MEMSLMETSPVEMSSLVSSNREKRKKRELCCRDHAGFNASPYMAFPHSSARRFLAPLLVFGAGEQAGSLRASRLSSWALF